MLVRPGLGGRVGGRVRKEEGEEEVGKGKGKGLERLEEAMALVGIAAE